MKPYHKNPRRITKKRHERLTDTLARLGDLGGIVHNLETDEVIGGNQRMTVFRDGEPVIVEQYDQPDEQGTVAHGFIVWQGKRYAYRQVRWDEATAEEANIAANVGAGTWDWDALSGWDADNLQQWGFDAETLQNWQADIGALSLMLASEEEPPQDDPGAQIDRAEELRELWGVQPGQLWQLGEHRLICGDARTAGLIGDFAILDPPWDWRASQYDEAMGWASWKKACCMGLSEMFPLSVRADYRSFWFWDQLTGVNISNQSPFLPMRSCIVMFDFGDPKRFYATEALRVLHKIDVCKNHIQSAPQYVPIVRKYTDGRDAMHSDVKPSALCDYIITLYSMRGEIVVDPFAGSGSFLLSSHRLGRQWQGSEIDPANCAVILERFYDATGITPLRIDAVLSSEAV